MHMHECDGTAIEYKNKSLTTPCNVMLTLIVHYSTFVQVYRGKWETVHEVREKATHAKRHDYVVFISVHRVVLNGGM